MKLAINAVTATTVNPANTKFFYVTTADVAAGTTLTIDAAAFFQDSGDPVTALPDLVLNNSYYNVYVNGVLQMEDLSTYTPGITAVGSLAFTVPAGGGDILAGSPVVLEVINFAPASTVDIET